MPVCGEGCECDKPIQQFKYLNNFYCKFILSRMVKENTNTRDQKSVILSFLASFKMFLCVL